MQDACAKSQSLIESHWTISPDLCTPGPLQNAIPLAQFAGRINIHDSMSAPRVATWYFTYRFWGPNRGLGRMRARR